MTTSALSPPGRVIVADDHVVVERLQVDDPMVVDLMTAIEPHRRADELRSTISLGARGLAAMGSRATANHVGEVVERLLADTGRRTEEHVGEILAEGRRTLQESLDPELRTSVTSRTVDTLSQLHDRTLAMLDPDHRDSHTARFVAELNSALGPAGKLEALLAGALDPNAADSAMAKVVATLEERLRELRDLIVGEQQHREASARGTAKGLEFEDVVEEALRAEARSLGGAVVERTGTVSGALGTGAVVGDLVVSLHCGTTVAVEAKHSARISLRGADGILDELDRAMLNRGATWAICVSHDDAYPAEVGPFGVYGNRVLIVDDGDGQLIRLALRWVSAAASAGRGGAAADVDSIRHGIERLRGLATRFSRSKRSLAAVRSSIDELRNQLDELRTDLIDAVDDMALHVGRDEAAATDAPAQVA
jgi:hypothetical protein